MVLFVPINLIIKNSNFYLITSKASNFEVDGFTYVTLLIGAGFSKNSSGSSFLALSFLGTDSFNFYIF